MLKEIIYRSLEKSGDHVSKNPEFTGSPSAINDCRRKLYYKKKNYEVSNPISAASKLKMEVGNLIHDYLKQILETSREVKYIWGEELKTIDWRGLTWWYKLDNLIEIKGTRFVIEVKSMFMTGWDEVQDKPKDEHVLQMLLYMIFENVSNGILLYIDRASCRMIEYNFDAWDLSQYYEKQLYKKVDNLVMLKDQISNNELPDRDYQAYMKRTESLSWKFQKDNKQYKTDHHCSSYCSYRDLCYKDVIETIQKGQFYIDEKIV
jgi:CRISPR/Cas system-associated exonuclease Cas4 (RecB family)